jgi:hypothetical protein
MDLPGALLRLGVKAAQFHVLRLRFVLSHPFRIFSSKFFFEKQRKGWGTQQVRELAS